VLDRTRALALANQELESFSYSVSHDLRAPLQVIDGFGRALLTRYGESLEPQARHYLDRMRDNTRQMGQLIDDLLALARVTRAEIASEPFDLAPRRTRSSSGCASSRRSAASRCGSTARCRARAIRACLRWCWKT
jgi:signal transduction histidine kinase